jgi:hypothetical protein
LDDPHHGGVEIGGAVAAHAAGFLGRSLSPSVVFGRSVLAATARFARSARGIRLNRTVPFATASAAWVNLSQ